MSSVAGLRCVCPVIPQCQEYDHCSTCVEVEDCAWCASENKCMTVSDIFGQDCRGTVFDPPCPSSFVGGEEIAS